MHQKRFKKIYVEITNVCNLQCSFCSISNRKTGFMPLNQFSEIVEKIHKHTNYIYLHVKGEPLLHPELSEILDICHKYKLRVVLVTNGTLIKDKSELLLTKPALRQINISLHCFSELPALKDKPDYINTIIAFTQKALSLSNIMISLRFWNIDKMNQANHPDNQFILNEIEQAFSPGSGLTEILKPGKGLKLHERLYINSDFEFSWPDINDPYDNSNGFCYGLRDQVAILYDGTIVPCCLDGEGVINLGNIHENEIQQIIDSSRAKNLYNGFSQAKRVEILCRKCRFNKME